MNNNDQHLNIPRVTFHVNQQQHQRISAKQSFQKSPIKRPKSALSWQQEKKQFKTSKLISTFNPSTNITTNHSPRINKQRLFDPFNNPPGSAGANNAFPSKPQPPTASSSSSPPPKLSQSPRTYDFNMPNNQNEPIVIDQAKSSSNWKKCYNLSNDRNNNNEQLKFIGGGNNWRRPSRSKGRNNNNIMLSKCNTNIYKTRSNNGSTVIKRDDCFDLTTLKQYQLPSLKRITLQPPTYNERKHYFYNYNKIDETWETIMFPIKIPINSCNNVKLLENWLKETLVEYKNLKFSSSDSRKDRRFFHLAALNEIAHQIEQKYANHRNRGGVVNRKSNIEKNEHSRVIRSICRSLLKMDKDDCNYDCSNINDGIKDFTVKGGTDKETARLQGNYHNGYRRCDLSEIVYKQAQIMSDLQEELRYEKLARKKAEDELKFFIKD